MVSVPVILTPLKIAEPVADMVSVIVSMPSVSVTSFPNRVVSSVFTGITEPPLERLTNSVVAILVELSPSGGVVDRGSPVSVGELTSAFLSATFPPS